MSFCFPAYRCPGCGEMLDKYLEIRDTVQTVVHQTTSEDPKEVRVEPVGNDGGVWYACPQCHAQLPEDGVRDLEMLRGAFRHMFPEPSGEKRAKWLCSSEGQAYICPHCGAEQASVQETKVDLMCYHLNLAGEVDKEFTIDTFGHPVLECPDCEGRLASTFWKDGEIDR